MSAKRERVEIVVTDGFSGRMAACAHAAASLTHTFSRLDLWAATWEPHDWSEWT